MRALLFFFFLAVSACAGLEVQTLPALKPAETAEPAASESAHQEAQQPSTGEAEKPHLTTFPSFPGHWGAIWGPFLPTLPTDRHMQPNQGFFPGGFNQGIYPGLTPGFVPGFNPGLNPGPFPGFGPQVPFPGFGR